MKRLFAAIKITPDENFLRIYFSLISLCKYDKINWVKPENIHITLKFFGETAEDRIESIKSKLSEISNQHKPFQLNLSNVGIFGSYYKPRVIWFGIGKNEALEKLANEVLDKMNDIGFLRDRQNFVPHLTVGRIKFIDDKNRFSERIEKYESTDIQQIQVESIYLFESKLSSSGPEYRILEKFNLNG